MPVYNAEKYIAEAIDSVIIGDDEAMRVRMLLIDDGSTDGSSAICKKYAKDYESIICISQDNQGVSIARNKGLEYIYNHCAENDWVGFLDADDLYEQGWKQVLSNAICGIDENYEKIDIIGFGMSVTDENKGIKGIINQAEEKVIKGGYETTVTENRKISFAAYIYRAKFLKDNHIFFISHLSNGEDLMFKYESFFAAEYLKYYPSRVYVYRQNKDSVTNNYCRNAEDYYSMFFLAWEGLKQWLSRREETEESIKLFAYIQQKINYSCMYEARSYCCWHNGSYKDLKNQILPYLEKHFMPSVLFEKDDNITRKDYELLVNHTIIFWIKYTIKGTFDDIKQKIKKIL